MRYICGICGYVYDDEKEEVPFSELPDSWTCPMCGAPKSAFEAEVKIEEVKNIEIKPIREEENLGKLSFGQLAAIFSNLSRGAEKQYKSEEAECFKKIAEYYTAITPEEEKSSIEDLARRLKEDIINRYPLTKSTAEENGDRGAQRICVWGEKVTKMLSSLIERYLKDGEEMLKGVNVYVCTVCGFVYIGDKAPALCPVCKVPEWKFEKI